MPLVETVQSKFSTESRPFFRKRYRRQFGKTESPGIHQESNTRLAQSFEPCTPYYDLRTASHGYDESMTLNTNIISLTSIFHNLVSDSLNIQNCQILDSESQPRWNCIKHRPTTRTLITIPTTRLSYDFPTFFLSNTRSMANKLDEISVTITNNKCDIAIITESWLSSNITNDLIKIPGFSCIRNDRCDDQRGGGLCTYIRNTLDFLELKDLSHPDIESQWFLIKPKRLPRGIDVIVIASVYHPPQNNDLTLRNHLFESLDNALTNFPNAGIVLLGDFYN